MEEHIYRYPSPIGLLTITADPNGITGLWLPKNLPEGLVGVEDSKPNAHIAKNKWEVPGCDGNNFLIGIFEVQVSAEVVVISFPRNCCTHRDAPFC